MLGKKPLYQQLIDHILSYISDEKLVPGDQIMTETDICEKYAVSRATVRQAIQELVNAGVLVKLHGRGTFIAEPKYKMNVGTFYSFSSMAKEQKFNTSTQILCFQELSDPSLKVKKRLSLEDGEPSFFLSRLRSIDRNPVLLENTYVPKKLIPYFDLLKVEKSSLYDYFNEFGISNLTGTERFTAYMPTPEEKESLKILDNDPCIRIRRLLYHQGMPIEYTVSILKNGTIQLESDINRP